MNPLFAAVVGTVVIAAVPPLRRRVVPVGSAVAGGAVALAESTIEGVSGVVGAVAGGWPASPRHSSEANVPSTPDQRAHKTPKPKTGCGIDTVCRFHTPDSLDAIEVFEQILDRDGLDIVLRELDGEVLGATYLNVIPNLSRGGRPYAVIENVVIAAHRRGEKLGQIRCRQGLPTCCRI